jgi:hypothetical protein
MENLYLIKINDEHESFYKIGTTVHRFCRFYEIMKHGYNVEIIYMILGINFYEALNAETQLQGMFNSYIPCKKFGGYTECFSSIDLNKYKKVSNELISSYKEITQNLKISWR